MGLLILWLVMGGVVAVIANSKGLDTFAWFIYGALIWPIALTHVIVKPAANRRAAARVDGTGAALLRHDNATSEAGKVCPDCAETIKAAAVVCRFCGNRGFPTAKADSGQEDEFLASLGAYKPKPQPSTWQKLWWNPHADKRKP